MPRDCSGRCAVLSVASEIFPLVKTGGLADVVGALPRALAREGIDGAHAAFLATRRCAMRSRAPKPCTRFPICTGERRAYLAGRAADLDLYVLDAPHLYDRPGNPYLGPDGKEWPDNGRRFAALAQGAAAMARGAVAEPSCRRSRTRTIGRRASRRPICATGRDARAGR